MMDCSRVFSRGVDPCLQYFEDEEVVLLHHPCIHNPAFEVRITLLDERRRHMGRRRRSEEEGPELVNAPSGGIAALHRLFRQIHCRDVDDTLPGGLQDTERMAPVADHAAHDRRLELHHRVPRHRHNVRTSLSDRRNHYDRSGFKQPIDTGQGKHSFLHPRSSYFLPPNTNTFIQYIMNENIRRVSIVVEKLFRCDSYYNRDIVIMKSQMTELTYASKRIMEVFRYFRIGKDGYLSLKLLLSKRHLWQDIEEEQFNQAMRELIEIDFIRKIKNPDGWKLLESGDTYLKQFRLWVN